MAQALQNYIAFFSSTNSRTAQKSLLITYQLLISKHANGQFNAHDQKGSPFISPRNKDTELFFFGEKKGRIVTLAPLMATPRCILADSA